MQDGSEASKALDRVLDVRDQPKAEHPAYSELPDRGRKWPRPVRVAFIAGSAAALWVMIFAGLRLI